MFIDAPVGHGKSRLLDAASGLAQETGMRVIDARGGELEGDFAFGLAIQLFESHWFSADAGERAALLEGPARAVGDLITGSVSQLDRLSGERRYQYVRGLFWLTCHLAIPPIDGPQGGPLALLVDDIHWADAWSLRFLAYLADRIRSLPIALVVAAGAGEQSSEPRALAALRRTADDYILRLRPLSDHGVAMVVRDAFAAPDNAFIRSCARATGGNPFLLVELLRKVRDLEAPPTARTARLVADFVPDAVQKAMTSRLAAMPSEARALAMAVAVLGSETPLGQAARVAGLEVAEAVAAADALASVCLFRPGTPLAFAHPLIGSAVKASLSGLARGNIHLRAASVLEHEGAAGDALATHRLAAPVDPERALARGRALLREHRHREASDIFIAALGQAGGADTTLADELEAAYISAAAFVPDRVSDVRSRAESLRRRAARHPSLAQRAALTHLAALGGVLGQSRAAVTQLVDTAWNDEEPIAPTPEEPVWPLLAGSLLFVDELERSLEICASALPMTLERLSPGGYAAATYCRASALYHQGRIVDALAAAQSSLDAALDEGRPSPLSALGPAALGLLQCGELAQADQTLSPLANPAALNPIDVPVLLDARAQLRLAQLRPSEALADAAEAGRSSHTYDGPAAPGAVAWRSTAALAHLALGDRTAARQLASEELRLARASGVTRLVVRNLRVLGLAEHRERRLALLEEAVKTGDAGPTRLEHVHALVDFGSALRRSNRRAAARGPLRRALELSHRGGIRQLADRARQELIASGARPRRARTTGPDSLTPSERRVAELAARGLTTRQIAATLFVSPKTVEFHLRHVYEKLAVASSRFELARAMRAARLDVRVADPDYGAEPVLGSPPAAVDSRAAAVAG